MNKRYVGRTLQFLLDPSRDKRGRCSIRTVSKTRGSLSENREGSPNMVAAVFIGTDRMNKRMTTFPRDRALRGRERRTGALGGDIWKRREKIASSLRSINRIACRWGAFFGSPRIEMQPFRYSIGDRGVRQKVGGRRRAIRLRRQGRSVFRTGGGDSRRGSN